MTTTGRTIAGLPLAVLLAVGGGSAARAQAPEPALLDCAAFPKATDEAALVRRFGRENVASATFDGGPEGESVRGTVVYPKDPARRLEITWADPKRRRGLGSIALRDRSAWAVRTGGGARPTLGLRADLEAVETANERPFTVNGFGWDMGGYGSGWKGGKLDHVPGGCFFTARFSPDPTVRGRALDKVSGEKEFGSSDPALRAARPFVSSISLDWPE